MAPPSGDKAPPYTSLPRLNAECHRFLNAATIPSATAQSLARYYISLLRSRLILDPGESMSRRPAPPPGRGLRPPRHRLARKPQVLEGRALFGPDAQISATRGAQGKQVRVEEGGKKLPQLGSPHPRPSPWFSASLDAATTGGSRWVIRPVVAPVGDARVRAGLQPCEHSLSLGLTPASRALPGEPAAARSRLQSRTHPAGFEPVHSAWTSSSTVSTTCPPAVTCEREKRGATPGRMDPSETE